MISGIESVAYKYCKFATQLRYEDLPNEVVSKAKELILDQIGVQLAASTLPWCKAVYNYVKEMKLKGNTTVVNYGFRTHPEFAVLANATFGHGFELDDFWPPAPAHPGCVAIPVALALGEETAVGGKDVILSVVIGYEVSLGVALAGAASFVVERGFHETSVEGVIGAAAMAGKMLKLSETELTNALSIAASHASGIMEYTRTGGEVKRYHGGIGAAGGIRSALLAKNGLTGPSTALEGEKGLLQAISNKYNSALLTEGLGERYKILDTAIKPYAVPGTLHPPIEGVSLLVKENNLKPEDIESIEVGTYRLALWHIGSVGPHPKDVTQAQFNVHFGLALTIVKGANNFHVYKEQFERGFKDPEVIAMAEKVRLVLDEEAEKVYPATRMARVTIRTKDGRTLNTRVKGCKGMRDKPLSQEELKGKFRELASVALPKERVEEIIGMITNLDKLERISELMRLLVA